MIDVILGIETRQKEPEIKQRTHFDKVYETLDSISNPKYLVMVILVIIYSFKS